MRQHRATHINLAVPRVMRQSAGDLAPTETGKVDASHGLARAGEALARAAETEAGEQRLPADLLALAVVRCDLGAIAR